MEYIRLRPTLRSPNTRELCFATQICAEREVYSVCRETTFQCLRLRFYRAMTHESRVLGSVACSGTNPNAPFCFI